MWPSTEKEGVYATTMNFHFELGTRGECEQRYEISICLSGFSSF